MFKLRPAAEMDAEVLLVMLEKFHNESCYSAIEFVPDHAAIVLFRQIDEGLVFVAENDMEEAIGVIGYDIAHMPMNDDVVMAAEKYFYVEKEYRKAGIADLLLEFAEAMLAEDVDYFVVCALSTSRPAIHRWYQGKGYVPFEMAYVKGV